MLRGRILGKVIERWPKPAEVTDIEWLVWRELERRRIPFDYQKEFAGGRTLGGMVVDFLLRDRPVIIRVQGWAHKSMPETIARDALAAEYLRGLGYRVVDLDEETIKMRLEWALDRELGIPIREAE